MRTLVASMLLLAPALIAADLGGTWMQEMAGRGGSQPRKTYYYFKVQGNTFTGSMVSTSDRREVTNGKIEGDTITFESKGPFQDAPQQMRGTLNGEELTIMGAGRGRGPGAPPAGMAGRGPGAPGAAAGRGPGGRGFTPPVFHKISAENKIPADLLPSHKPLPPITSALPPNGLAKTPPMGWNSWNKFRAEVSDKNVREMADAIVSSGMRDAGYIYVNIDDTWEAGRDANGNIQTNEKFPDMKALADYVHSKGLKLGIYSGPGPLTCAGYIASYGHEDQDAKTYAAWGIDYLKYDWCSASGVYTREEHAPAYMLMGKALRASGRPIVYSLCQYGMLDVGEWGAKVGGNLWRTTGDIRDSWDSMSHIGFDLQPGREKFAGPGHWNDPDMLEIGNGGMTDTEYRTHMSLWSILAAPLLAGNDIRSMSDSIKEILLNKEVIAVDQDKKGVQGTRVRKDGDLEVWKKPLEKGVAVGLFNRGAETARMSVKWSEVGVTKKNPKVRDLWAHQDLKAGGEYTVEVPSHGVVMLKVE
ncbi:MAG: glycoside hydrolase family 27 protein [Acidobacteria bacterium]|nr:glycoside hydrolase family 27 protein [Acidobacteriota bacterium]